MSYKEKAFTGGEIPMAQATAVGGFIDGVGEIYLPDKRPEHMQQLGSKQYDALRAQGFPEGLAKELGQVTSYYPIRFWVVDNSGSMLNNDGRSIRISGNKAMIVPCTRWKELQSTVEYHATMAAMLEAGTIFRLLNDPGRNVGPQEFSIMASETGYQTIRQDIDIAKAVINKSQPQGATPLTYHLCLIRQKIESIAHLLEQRGQKAVVVIATDGLPTFDKDEISTPETQSEFVNVLRTLQNLPVWLVIRLCTNDAEIVKFYNDLDTKLELPMEVLDDLFDEGKEVQRYNDWLNYSLPIHRCREMGYHHRIFDLLDERKLSLDEIREFLTVMFGADKLADAPDIYTNYKGWVRCVGKVVKEVGKTFNPVTQQMEPWVNMKQLEKQCKSLSGRGGWFSSSKKVGI